MRRSGIAAFSDLRTPSADGVRDAITTRPTASANFYVDSLDKPDGANAGDFIINKNQSLFNGYFNRLAVNEVVMDWGIPNVSKYWANNFVTVYTNVAGVVGGPFTATLTDGFYTADQALSEVVRQLNLVSGPTVFSIGLTNNIVALGATNPYVVYWDTTETVLPAVGPYPSTTYYPGKALSRALFSRGQLYTGTLPPAAGSITQSLYEISSPLILGTQYVDIVSQQLTYNQELKDATTAPVVRDVLYRFYLAWDNETSYDQELVSAGPPAQFINTFPVYQGYRPFLQRRELSYPKQIRWSPEQPIGQVSFQAYDDEGRIINVNNFPSTNVSGLFTGGANFNFKLSMLLSED